MLQRLSIRSQLILSVAAALLLLIIGLEISATIQERNALLAAERERGTVLTNDFPGMIAEAGESITRLEDVSGVEDRLTAAVQQNEGIKFIAVAWPDGKVVFHSDPTYKGQTVDAFAGLQHDESIQADLAGFGSTYMSSFTYDNPMSGDTSPTFTTIVGTDSAYINQPLQDRLITSVLIALGAAILIGMLMIYINQNIVTIPIQRVREGARAFSQGDLTHRIQVGGVREISELGQTMNEMAGQLVQTRQQVEDSTRTLEQRVVERTRDLFLTIEVGQLASSIFHQDPLLRRVTDFILEQFKLYYVQVYLLDDTRRYAVLQYGTGEVGKRLMSYQHRLDMNDVAIVTRAATTGLPVLVADTEGSEVHLKNPLLPATRSEVAVPLSIGGQVLGVLDLQADQPNTFNADNLPVFEAMANQLTASLRGAQAYEAAERAVDRADAINRRLTYETWESYLGRAGEGEQVVYHYDLQRVTPFVPETSAPTDNGQLELPILLRGESIGNIVVAQESGQDWSDDDRQLIQGVAERLALTIEQYRAFDETQVALRQTARLYQASRRIGTADNLQEVVRTVAEAFEIPAIESGVLFNYERDANGKIQSAVAVANWRSADRDILPIGTRFEDLHTMPGAQLALSQDPTFVQDIYHDPRLDPTALHIFEQLQIGALIYLPLWIGGRQVGTLSFESSEPYNFTQNDLQVGTALAQQAAFAIENRNLLEQMQNTLAETRLLYQASRSISTAASEAEVVEALVRNVPVEGIDRVLVALIKEYQGNAPALVEVTGVWDRDKHESAFLGNQFTPEVMPVLGIIGPDDVLMINDFEKPENPAIDPRTQAAFRHLGVRSAAILPIVTGRQIAGWLLLETTAATRTFTDQDIAPYLTLVDQAAVALQSHRLFEEAQHQALELQSMAEVSVQSSTILDVDQLLWTVTDLAKERFGFYHVQIYLLDDENENLVLRAGAGDVGRTMVNAKHKIASNNERSLVARAARTGESVVVDDVFSVIDFLPNPMLPFTEAEVAIPLVAGRRVIGVLDIQASRDNRITESDIRLQTIFASQVAIAVQNAQLFVEAQSQALELQSMAEVSVQSSTILDVEQLLWTVTDLAKERFGFYHVQIYLLDDQNENLVLRAGAGDVGRQMVNAKHKIALNNERSLVARAARTGEPVVVDDVISAIDFMPNPMLPSTEAEVAIPLVAGRRVIGVLDIQASQDHHITETDIRLQTIFASQVAVAVQNARLFAEAQGQALELQSMAEVSVQSSTILDVEQLLWTVTDLAQERFGFYHVQIYLLDDQNENLVLRAGAGDVGRTMVNAEHKIALNNERSLVARAARTGEPVVVDDVFSVIDFLPNPMLPSTEAEVAIPLVAGRRVIGVLDIQASQDHHITETDIRLQTIFASQVAVAVQNARLFAESQGQALELQSMAEVSVQSSTILDVDQLLWTVTDLAKERFGFYHVQIYLLDDQNENLVLRAGAGDVGRTMVNAEHKIALNNERSLVARAARTGDPVVVDDVFSVSDFLPNPMLPSTKSEAAIPLVAGRRVLGVLDIQESQDHRITESDIRLQTIFASQVAIAVQNARLFVEANTRSDTLKQQQAALAGLAQSEAFTEGNLDDVITTITQVAAETLGVERTSIWFFSEDGLAIQCLDLYEASAERHSSGIELTEEDYPTYFQALRDLTSVIAADDAHTHPVTQEFSENYLTPLNIYSMLDAPIRLGNQTRGVICHEQVGSFRQWSLEEQSFSNSIASLVSLALETAERRQAEAETRRRALEVQTVADVGVQASTILDVEELLWTVSDLTRDNFDLYHVHIYLLDEVTERLVLRAGAGIIGRRMVESQHSIALSNERSLVARAARSHHSAIVNNAHATPDFLPNPLLPATMSEMAVPMISGETIVGVLDVQSDKINYFTEDDARVHSTLASQIAATVQNARLFEQTNKRAAELRTVAEVSAEASTSLDPTLLLKRVSDLTKERFGLYHAHVYLLDTSEETLVLAAGAGQVGDLMAGSFHSISLDRARSLVARAARTRQPVIANDVRLEEDFLPNPLLPGTRAEMAVPMIAGDQLIGVLDVQADQENYFKNEDVQIQTTLASQIAIAVANARLFTQTQNSLAETALLYVASRSIAAARDPQALVATLIESVNIHTINRAILFTFEYSDAGDMIALKAVANWYRGEGTPPSEVGRRYSLSQYPSFRLALGTDPVFYDDTLHDDRIDAELYEVLAEQNILAMAVLPLWFGDRQIGSLYLQAEESYHFTDAEIRPFATLASQAALALNGLQLLAMASQRASELQTVAEVGTQATTLLNLDELLQTAVDLTKERFNLYHAHVYLMDENNEYLLLSAGAGDVGRRMTAAGHRIGVNNERSLVARAARTRQSVVVNDVMGASDFLPNPFLSRTRSEMALPLIAGSEVIGVLDVQAEEVGRFTSEDVQIKTTLASQLAVAVTNARSFAQEVAAEQALLQANLVVESSPAMLFKWDVDPSRPVMYVSDNVRQVGYTPEEFLSGEVTVNTIIHSDDRERIAQELATLVETGAESVSLEYRITAKDGQTRWVEARIGVGERDEEGNVTAYQGLFLDVTERERTSYRQRAAYELGQQLATLLDAGELLSETVNRLSDAFGYYHAQIYLYDESRSLLVMSEGLGEAGAIMKQGGHGITLSAARSLVARSARSLKPVTANNVMMDPDHLPNPLLPETRSEVAVPLFHGQELIGVLDIQHNVADYFNEDEIRTLSIIGNQLSTALANARLFGEIQLEAERRAMLYDFGQRLSETLDPAAIANVVVENVTALLDFPEATLIRYYPAENTLETLAAQGELGQKMIGLTVSATDRPDIRRVITRQEMEVVPNADEMTDPAYDMLRQAGLKAWMTLPVAVADQVIGVLSLGETRGPRDFTQDEILLAQNIAFQVSISLQNAYLYFEQVQITEQLREVDRLKSEFLASMSHELRTPLNSIIGYAEVLLDGIDGELTGEMDEDINAIHGSGKHLLNLINDILDLAKIEAGQMDLMTESVSLKPFVEELLTTTSRVLIMGKPVDMLTDIPDNIPQIQADPLRLRQVVSNLITNAIKFTEQGSITVRAEHYDPDPTMIHLSVVDTGIGITAENLPLIFDRFRQVDQSATRRVGGTGLGLSITRQLIQMHGGDMWVESEYGKGSSFHFTLPTVEHEE